MLGLWVEPLRRIVDEQGRMADMMATWAKQDRVLAEQLASSAQQLRRRSDESAAIVDPIIAYAARVSDMTDSGIGLLRPHDQS